MSFPIFQTYDEQARGGWYDRKINYTKRVKEIKKILPKIGKGSRVLDIACGTGAVIEALLMHKEIKVTGIDISEGMLEISRQKFKNLGQVKLLKGDFMEAGFENSSFDLIIMSHATRYIPVGREKEFVDKVSGWLKPKGLFIAILHQSPFSKIINFLVYVFGFPKTINISMTLDDSFIQTMSTRFHLEQSKKIGNKTFFVDFIALFLRKKKHAIPYNILSSPMSFN